MSGIAVHNRSLGQLERVVEATQLLNSTLELPELAQIILQLVRDEVEVERATIFRVDQERGLLVSLVAQELDGTEITMPFGVGIAGTVAARNALIDIPDAYADSRFNPEFDRTLGYRTRDIYCVPVTNRGGLVVGVLQLLNRTRAFNRETQDFIAAISIHIGLALEQACLYAELEQKRRMEAELTLMRDKLAQLEKLSLMGELIAGIVHEIRNPLAVLAAHSSFLREEAAELPVIAERVEKMDLATRKVLSVVQNFLGFARRDELRTEPVPVNDLIMQMLNLLSYEWKTLGIEVVTDLQLIPPVSAQYGQLQQVLLNLFKNAADAMRGREPAQLRVRTSCDAGSRIVRIEVEDNGPGVPADMREQIFHPFTTTKPRGEGTGLGLSVARRIVESFGGRIWAKDVQTGAAFIIELPFQPPSGLPPAG